MSVSRPETGHGPTTPAATGPATPAATGEATASAGATSAVSPEELSTGELLTRLSTQMSELVRGEMELARAELTAKGKRAGTGAGLAGAGAVVALFGVGALIAAAIAALALVTPVWLAALIVGVVLLIVAGVLALVGRKNLERATPPVPEKAVEGVQDDVATIKDAMRR